MVNVTGKTRASVQHQHSTMPGPRLLARIVPARTAFRAYTNDPDRTPVSPLVSPDAPHQAATCLNRGNDAALFFWPSLSFWPAAAASIFFFVFFCLHRGSVLVLFLRR